MSEQMPPCAHAHSTQFADPTPEGIARNLPAVALQPLGTMKCLDCGVLFQFYDPLRNTRSQPPAEAVRAAAEEIQQRAIQVCEEAQIGLGEWKEKQAGWESLDKRQVWNEAVIYCAETIETIISKHLARAEGEAPKDGERDAMIDTINELEKDRDALRLPESFVAAHGKSVTIDPLETSNDN